MRFITVTKDIILGEDDILFEFYVPDGANSGAIGARLRFDIDNADTLDDEVKEALVKIAGKRVTENNILVIEVDRHPTKKENLHVATGKLVEMVRRAASSAKERKKVRDDGKERRNRGKKQKGVSSPWSDYGGDDYWD